MGISEKINAIYVLQRFVRMSRILIPTYIELNRKMELSENDNYRIERIKSVYDNFRADPVASQYLINSNILGLIQRVYSSMKSEENDTPEGYHNYELFIKESDRLIKQWDRHLLN